MDLLFEIRNRGTVSLSLKTIEETTAISYISLKRHRTSTRAVCLLFIDNHNKRDHTQHTDVGETNLHPI